MSSPGRSRKMPRPWPQVLIEQKRTTRLHHLQNGHVKTAAFRFWPKYRISTPKRWQSCVGRSHRNWEVVGKHCACMWGQGKADWRVACISCGFIIIVAVNCELLLCNCWNRGWLWHYLQMLLVLSTEACFLHLHKEKLGLVMCSCGASPKCSSDCSPFPRELPLFTSLVLPDTPVKTGVLLMRSAVMKEPFLLPWTKLSWAHPRRKCGWGQVTGRSTGDCDKIQKL